jgi:hypothetical protein
VAKHSPTWFENQQNFENQLTNVTMEVSQLRTRFTPHGFPGQGTDLPTPYQTSAIKLELPRFDTMMTQKDYI